MIAPSTGSRSFFIRSRITRTTAAAVTTNDTRTTAEVPKWNAGNYNVIVFISSNNRNAFLIILVMGLSSKSKCRM